MRPEKSSACSRADKHIQEVIQLGNEEIRSFTWRGDPNVRNEVSIGVHHFRWFGSPADLEGWPLLKSYWLFLGADAVAKAKGSYASNGHHELPCVLNLGE
ncbi:unnamed protein product [Lasius platythorax]|uniref:Pyruvate or indole-3-pyruvate decarboxylase pdc n=2 Tax=Lasius TaxID=488720 RepID=A0A0J7KFC4_LASNI|nr:pyruvate or indole-3-pyruvate decarboxylase pdc [Lasius niger]